MKLTGAMFLFRCLKEREVKLIYFVFFCLGLTRFIFACSVTLKLHMFIQVSPSGWSEGECRGNAGWFPSAYVEKRQRIPTADVAGEVY